MNCKICETVVHKYKCPRCRIPYCSLGCWKVHQNEECQLLKPQENVVVEIDVNRPTREDYMFPTEDTVPIEQLKILGSSKGLLKVLENPQVRDILTTINKSPNPGAAISAAMQEPIFVEFADECFKITNPDPTGNRLQSL